MDGRRVLTAATALLLLAACSGARSQDHPGPRTGAGAPPAARPGGGPNVASSTGRIVFDTFEDIWTVNADGSNLTRLTRSPWPEFDATWSPDGTHIAYRSERRNR